jgi:hypothetical protein
MKNYNFNQVKTPPVQTFVSIMCGHRDGAIQCVCPAGVGACEFGVKSPCQVPECAGVHSGNCVDNSALSREDAHDLAAALRLPTSPLPRGLRAGEQPPWAVQKTEAAAAAAAVAAVAAAAAAAEKDTTGKDAAMDTVFILQAGLTALVAQLGNTLEAGTSG